MSAIADFATVSTGQISTAYVPDLMHPDPPETSPCCSGGGGSASGVIEYTAPAGTPPSFTPSTSAAIAINTTDGQHYSYYDGAWH